MKEVIGNPNPHVPLSDIVRAGDFVYISGQVPTDPNTLTVVGNGIEKQTTLVLQKIADLVQKAGGSMSDIVKTTVFLTDISVFADMNAAYKEFFPENPPARSCVKIDLALDALVEIEAIAYIPRR